MSKACISRMLIRRLAQVVKAGHLSLALATSARMELQLFCRATIYKDQIACPGYKLSK